MKCSELQAGQEVVFKIYSDIYKKKIFETGTVSFINKNTQTVCILWLEGYKNRDEMIPYRDMVAVSDENGEMMKFDNISGKSVLLTAE